MYKVDVKGIITTIAGNGMSGYNGDNIEATDAKLDYPYCLTSDIAGNIYICDNGDNRIRKVTFPVPPTATLEAY